MGETGGLEGLVPPGVRDLPPAAPVKPLAEASKRLRGPDRRGGQRRHLDPKQQGIALGMAAVGVPQNKIAQALAVPTKTVSDLAIRGDNKDVITEIRDKLKLTKMQKALFLEERLWNLAEKKIDAEDAKAVDGVLRAIHASEKIQQAVAGESIKIEQRGLAPAVDLAGLIQVLIQHG